MDMSRAKADLFVDRLYCSHSSKMRPSAKKGKLGWLISATRSPDHHEKPLHRIDGVEEDTK
jgi:hypothetical protein